MVNLASEGLSQRGRGVGRFLGLAMHEISAPGELVELSGSMKVTDMVVDRDGALNAGALFTIVDCIGGFCGGLGALPDGWVVTTNLRVRSMPSIVTDSLTMRSRVLRKGKSAIVTSVDIVDADGGFVADATVTSAVLIPADGVPEWPRPAALDLRAEPSGLRFADWIGARPICASEADDAVGATLELVDDLRNPWGFMHGGVTTALVDVSARAIAAAHAGIKAGLTAERFRTTDVVMHFISPARTGPISATGRVLGSRPDGDIVEIDVVDHGNADRLVAFAVATVAHLGVR